MHSRNIQEILNQLAGRRVPELPANFEQNVWREIRSQEAGYVRESIGGMLIAACLQPTWAVAASIVALFVSISFGAMEASVLQNAAHTPLNLGVFSADAPTLPSTLLVHFR